MNVVLRALAALVVASLLGCVNGGQTTFSRQAEKSGLSPNKWSVP